MTPGKESGDNGLVKYPSRRRRNLFILIVSILGAVLLSRQEWFYRWIMSLGSFGFVSAFLAGILFSSSFTAAFSLVIFAVLGRELPVLPVALLGGLGALAGDLVILRFFRDEIIRDLEPIYDQLGGGHLRRLLHTKYFSWTLPVIGAAIIASPLPDEIGISLLSMSHLPAWKFLIISFVMNSLGIFFITSVGSVL